MSAKSAKIPRPGNCAAGTRDLPSGPPKRRFRIVASKMLGFDPTRFGVYLGSGEGQQDFDCFTRMMIGAIQGRPIRSGAVHQGRTGRTASGRLSWSRNRTCRPDIWPAASTRKAQLELLDGLCRQQPGRSAKPSEIIRRGDADVMLSGGTHSMIHPFGVTGFNLLDRAEHQQRATAPRPRARSIATATDSCWAKARRWSILEELEHAKRRGARSTAKLPATVRLPMHFALPTRIPKGEVPAAASAWPWMTPA